MNKNYRVLTLTDRSNWIKAGDNLVFTCVLVGARYDHEYPHSLLDAIRVVRQALAQEGVLIDSEMHPDRWSITILSADWNKALDVMNDVFYHHDFGERLPVYRLEELGWDYNPAQPEQFTQNADYVKNAAEIAADLSDWTGFRVEFVDTSIDKGYWRVHLPTDDERRRFADACEQYERARARIAEAMDNGVLLLRQEQYQRAKEALDVVRWKRVTERNDMFVIAFDEEDTYTREIVNVLDAAGL